MLEPAIGDIDQLLAVVRLGDADRLGWWGSHSLDQPARFVLGNAFPSTWMATGLEMSMESARIRHDTELERETAVHVFSDHLPFRGLLTAWLIERKLERDLGPLEWLTEATTDDLRDRIGPPNAPERRGSRIFIGSLTRADAEDPDRLPDLLAELTSAYAGLDGEFLAPYMDLTD